MMRTKPLPVRPTATPEERIGEAVRLYDWQIQDILVRLSSCVDPRESAALHAKLTDARSKMDAALAITKAGPLVSINVVESPAFLALVDATLNALRGMPEARARVIEAWQSSARELQQPEPKVLVNATSG
jgi:hypothetical protein